MTRRISFDTGGTFTDLALVDVPTGALHTWKTLTTPDDPSVGVATGISELLEHADVAPVTVRDAVRGATTLVTNALLERKGARVGLVTTKGFADVIEIGREWRYDIYDLTITLPEPLVPAEHRYEVTERILADGSIAEPLRVEDLERIAADVREAGLEALAVCFLNSYRNNVHETKAARWLQTALPQIPVVSSSNGVGEIREYERTVTATASAYVAPVAQRHFRELKRATRSTGLDIDIVLMHSAGGLISTEGAAEQPIRVVESGSAAGALGAAFVARLLELPRAIAFDMGGTTAKIAVIDDGAPIVASQFEAARVHRFARGSGIPLVSPTIDLLEIGAGGGSLARIDELGLLKVGPASAGAAPGPACYQLGGDGATVTDSDLLLGYLSPSAFLGGRIELSTAAARSAIEKTVAEPLAIGVTVAAAGINRVVNESMAIAARIHLLEKGRDPRDYTLVAFGGAGPVHGRDVAARIGVRRVVCPIAAGVMSAVGLQIASASLDFTTAEDTLLRDAEWQVTRTMFAELEERARRELARLAVDHVRFERSVDLRYVGQSYEINVEIERELRDAALVESLVEAFHALYRRLFSAEPRPGEELEVVRWRLRASDAVAVPDIDLVPVHAHAPARSSAPNARTGERRIYDNVLGEFVEAAVYSQALLPPGATFTGPAMVEQRESTAVLFTGDIARVDDHRNLIVELGVHTEEGGA